MVDKDTKSGTRRQLIKMAGVAGAGLASSAGVASAGGSKGKKLEIKRWRCAGVRVKAYKGKGFSNVSKVHARYKKKNGESFAIRFKNTDKNLPQTKTKKGKTFKLNDAQLRIKGDPGGYTLKRIWTPETGTKKNPKFGECFKHKPEPEKPKVKCHGKKIVVKNVPEDADGHLTFVYKNRGGKKKQARITLNWIEPGETKQKRAFTITRTDSKVIAKVDANWTPYKAKGKVNGKRFSHECKYDDDNGDDYEKPEVKCKKDGKKAVVKPVPKKAEKGEVAVGVKNRKGEKVWSGFSLEWNEPGDSKHKKHVTYKRKHDKVVVKADEGWRIFYVDGSVHKKEFAKKCDYEFDKPDYDGPKCKFHSDKKLVIKNVPKKARKGSVAGAVRNKWGKTKWSGISLKWVTPGDKRWKNCIKYERTDNKIIVTSYKAGWKLHRVKGSVMGKKFDCKNEDEDDDGHGCYCKRWNKKKVVIKNVPKRCRKGKVAACIRKGSRTKWSGISLKWVKAGDTKWKNGVKYTRKHDKIVVECYKSDWDLHRVKGKIKGDEFDTNDH